jgi:hypothetical protein
MAEHQEIEGQSEPPPVYVASDTMAIALEEMVFAIYDALPPKRQRAALAKLEEASAKFSAQTNVYRLRTHPNVRLCEARREAAPVLKSVVYQWRERLNARGARSRVDGRS